MEQNHSANTKRIAKNTLILYGRMLLSMAVALFTTRVVLDTLGASDYGIYNLVGGVVGLMGVVTSLLSQGTSRFITIALGKNNFEGLKHTFSASVTIHLLLAAIILVIGETVGPLIVNGLNIPVDRIGAAQFVFQLSLLSSIVGIVQSPYNAAIVAHERMSVYAYISIWDVVAKLSIVYILTIIDVDKLKLYSLLFFFVGIVTAMICRFYSRKHFDECRSIVLRIDNKLYKEILNYTGWNAVGSLAFTMNGQGITILLSSFGTAVNAARGIAGSASGIVYKFVEGFQIASRPQIIKLCAVGDYVAMNNLITQISRFSSYLIGIIGIPLFLEMDFVLQIWLKEVPAYTVVFTRLTLIQFLIQSMDFPLGTGIHAVGKMKLPNITSSFIYMIILPISYIAIKSGASPEVAYVMIVAVYPMAMLMDLYIIKKYTGFKVCQFLLSVVLKSILFIVFTGIITYNIVNYMVDGGFERVIVTVLLSSFIFSLLVYIWGLTHDDKKLVKKIIVSRLEKLINK